MLFNYYFLFEKIIITNLNGIHYRHGYRGIDSRRNLWVLPTGEIMYYVASVVVLYDRDEDSQRHYIGHTEDVQW